MSEERDPFLETRFAEVHEELSDGAFTRQVIKKTEARRRRVLFGRLGVVVLLVALELLLDAPLQNSVGALTQTLSTDLFEINHEWLEFVVGPANSVAGLVGLALLGIHFVIRKIIH